MAKGERILVVDDQEDNVFILEQLLQRNGYQVAVARDGVEALEKAAEQRPDVVLLDINMPRMDRLEVCRRRKSDQSMAGAAIILISARTEKGQRVEGLDAGADDYISKPFSPKELLARVRAQLRLKGRQDQLRDSNETLKEISIRDALTGLFNRGYLDARIEEEIARRDRIAAPLSVALVDIDLFKRVNDTRGHLCGDEVLREVGAEILASVRRCDVAARYGGEEFCVVLPDADRHGARRVAERLRAAVEAKVMTFAGEDFHVTVSVGVAQFSHELSGAPDLLALADRALYDAKEQGRNRVVVAATPVPVEGLLPSDPGAEEFSDRSESATPR